MALIGYGRVSTDRQNTDRQRDALSDAGCIKIFEEKISGTVGHEQRPELSKALEHLRPGDMITVQEIDRLGRDLMDGLIMLGKLFEQGVTVKVLSGLAAGEHTERNMAIDFALAFAEERRRDISRKTKNGLEATKRRGTQLGRRAVMSEAMVVQAVALRDKGFTIRQIQPHLTYKTQGGETRNPSVGAISNALKAHDDAQG
ncbi:recombinase family protein [Streptomyces antibioticus]|uniref:recombinase family protein n=1 Tax=Streptomyces antibioticus TaxID=1890 RepID=UPI003F4784E0